MYLKHLTINGFKSFAKKSELEFSAPITAIVGPNGSGKSNVAEAFRFVLGEQSPSKMRGKKGEDLIWGGTDQVSRGSRASVSMLLQNEKRIFPIDFDELTLERVVYRDGVNDYLINGSKVRLKDIQETLAAANIGPSGHHIISQGEADRILSANPKERREMIEDALGLKVYQFKRVEAERKLQKTKDNIEQVESLRREVAPHLKFLERQLKKIERAVELRDKLKTFYAEYLKREDTYLAYHFDRLRSERQTPENKLAELKIELEKAKKTLASVGEDEKRNQLINAEAALSKARELKQEALRQNGQLEGQISFLKRRIAEVKNKAAQEPTVNVSYKEVKTIIAAVESDVEKVVNKDDVALLSRTLGDIVHKLKQFLSSVSSGDLSDLSRQEEEDLEELLKQKNKADKELEEKIALEKKAEAGYTNIKTEIEAEASESRAAEREMFRIVNEQKEFEAKLANLDHELSVIERDREEFKRELQEAVTLLGRDASLYQNVVVKDGDTAIEPKTIVSENREVQRERCHELEKMKIRLEEFGGANSDIEKEYKEVKERDDFLVREITDLNSSVEKLESLIKDLSDKLNERFVTGIEKIGTEFHRFFVLMFGGGSAELRRVKPKVKKKAELDDEMLETTETPVEAEIDEEAEEGIEIDVKLPNKRIKGLDMLSGGERALTSIALIFAMSQVNPPLFIILDETDAALDEANSRRYGDMIEALSKKSQLILITHNRETMSRAGILYGVTMSGDGVSKLLSVKFDEAVAVAK